MAKDPYKNSKMFSFVIHGKEFEMGIEEFVLFAQERLDEVFKLVMQEYMTQRALRRTEPT